MVDIKYVKFDELNAEELKALLNKPKIREHLIEHPLFDSSTIKSWIQGKCDVDRIVGCRVRGIVSNNSVAGWCGIQFENGKYELAIVLDEQFWGMGKKVFNDMLSWARELGHKEVYIHFLYTRPEYKFLRRISNNVFETEMFGTQFTTYQIVLG